MELLYKDLTGKIVDCAVKVHKQLGPGLIRALPVSSVQPVVK